MRVEYTKLRVCDRNLTRRRFVAGEWERCRARLVPSEVPCIIRFSGSRAPGHLDLRARRVGAAVP